MAGKYKLPTSVFLLTCVLLVIFASNISNHAVDPPDAVYGLPTYYLNESELSKHLIQQIVDDGKNIYLLLDDHKGIVQVYDTDGKYQKSIVFHSNLNGAFKLAVSNGMFFVCDQSSNLYQFQDGNFISFFPYTSGEALRKSLDFESNSLNYYIQSGSVWRYSPDGETCIIQHPAANLQRFSQVANVSLVAIVFVAFGFRLMRSKYKRV